ncbi:MULTISPECIES: SHOCT domain-containing protein [Kitasatospora]|uniref:SHOCT domain-containing protein n=1 Tax=Kitasatospora TaxID=2063 RepID=UPI0004C2B8C2|nr:MULTISPECIES: SHOCT domain-containing protein [unclassified Kitasatospora]WAL70983.1 SHOCT domain-containing protein [Kitasatospora sp. YST-16]WNW37021.1 SHOCT domain-containing protein [Streptomyces sp. Li-HN-5-13]
MVTLLADGWSGHGPGPWVLVFPLFWLLVVVLVVTVLRRSVWRRRGWCGGGEHAPLAVLGRRYAQGEIDEAEYRERRGVLTEEQGSGGGKR